MEPFIIGPNTNLVDVARWGETGTSRVEFIVTVDASFSLFSEEAGIGALQVLREDATRVVVRCQFPLPSGTLLSENTSSGRESFFLTAFGVQLLHVAKELHDDSGRNEFMLIQEYREATWSFVRKRRGVMGDSHKRYLLSREPDYRFPDILTKYGDLTYSPRINMLMPTPQQLRFLLRDQGRKLVRGKESYSNSESEILTFAYEAFENVLLHARKRNGRLISGYRSLTFRKYELPRGVDLDSRQELPDFVREYLKARTSSEIRQHVLALTISDLGGGIHSTIPTIKPGETLLARVNRAFNLSQESQASDERLRHFGLKKMRTACHALGALLVVRSSMLIANHNFSIASSDFALVEPIPKLRLAPIGSDITALWVETSHGGDQPAFDLSG